MIKWYSKFNIPDASVQLYECYIRIKDKKTINGSTTVTYIISDKMETIIPKENEPMSLEHVENIVKTITVVLEKTFNNDDEIYIELQKEFNDSEII